MAVSEHDTTEHSPIPRRIKLGIDGTAPNGADDAGAFHPAAGGGEPSNHLASRVATLSEIAVQIDAARSREEILQVVREQAKWLIEHDLCMAAIVNRARTHYALASLSATSDAADFDHKHFLLSQGMPGWVIQHQVPVAGDLAGGPAFTESLEGMLTRLGMRSMLVVPLRTGNEAIGALTFASTRPDAYCDGETWIAQMLAVLTATAVKNTAIFEDAQKRLSQIELVNEIGGTLTSTLELDDLLAAAAETVQKSFSYFDVTIFLVDRKADELVLVAHAGSYGDFLPAGYRQRPSEGIVGWVASNGERCLVNDVTEDPRYMAYEYHSTKSELAIPIRIGTDVVGVLNIEDTRLHAFDETDAVVLDTLCDQLGSAIKNARLYDEVRRANAKLTELDRMKSDFLGIVSHDFRSPLASIILAARALLKRQDFTDQQRLQEYLTIIVDQANRLSMLAEDTLSITKMESGQLTYFHKVVNVERLIKDAAAMVSFSRRHSIEYHVDPGIAYIKGDQTKLRQVLQNLLSNAVKYSPSGGKVNVTAVDKGDNCLQVSVADEGIGIPPEQVGRLFQKFSRIDTAEAREIKGSGLGLWICREIVRAHGGEIWVESDQGKGSIFSFTLRKSQPEHEDSRPPGRDKN
jgi:K+-sensing histidine kinase KdpD